MSPGELRAEKPDDVLFSGVGRSPADRLLRGRPAVRQRRRRVAGSAVQRGLRRAASEPRRRRPVPGQQDAGPPHRPGRAALRRGSRGRSPLGDLAGPCRDRAQLEAVRAARADRGGGRPRPVQAAPAPRRAEARPRRGPGRSRARSRRRGQEAAAAARAPGDRRRARREARGRDLRACRRRSRRSTSSAWHERRAEAEGRRAATAEQRRALDEQINALVAEREAAEEELTDSAGAREQATAALYRLRSGGERIALRRESASSLDLVAARRSRRRRVLRPVRVDRSWKQRHATRRLPPSRPRPSGRAFRSRPKDAGRASLRSNASNSPPSPPSSTRCSAAAPRPSRSSPAAAATPCWRCAAPRSVSVCGTSRRSACWPSCSSELADARHVPARPTPAELGRAGRRRRRCRSHRCAGTRGSRCARASRTRAPGRTRAVARRTRGSAARRTRAR